MTIISYFFDSVGGDRPYSASDFATAFGIAFDTGIMSKEAGGLELGFLQGGAGLTTIYGGRAMIEGHFVSMDVGQTITVPAGSYSGMVVLRLDILDSRTATLEVRTDQTPQQDTAIWELPLWGITVVNGVITGNVDLRVQGGAVAKLPTNIPTYQYKNNGVYLNLGVYKIALTPAQPPMEEKLVWIQIDN